MAQEEWAFWLDDKLQIFWGHLAHCRENFRHSLRKGCGRAPDGEEILQCRRGIGTELWLKEIDGHLFLEIEPTDELPICLGDLAAEAQIRNLKEQFFLR